MKLDYKKIPRSALSVVLALCMLLSCFYVGLSPINAAKVEDEAVGGSWIAFKRLYFGVPTSWTNSFTNLYAAARQTNGYCTIIGKLTEQVSGSRIYGTTTGQNIDHSSWGSEYLYIFASNTSYSVGSGYGSVTTVYATSTTTSNMVNVTSLNNTANNYFIYPTTDANGAAISSRWNNYGDMGYLGTDGTIENGQGDTPYAQQKTSCSSGGSASISGYRITANSAASFTSHSGTSQLGCIVGSRVTITATANSNYNFDGFYSNSSYSQKITTGVSGNTYTYTVTSTTDKTVYLKFSAAETTYSVSVVSEDTSKGTVAASTVQAGATTAVTIPTATPKYGYKFKQWVATSPATVSSGSTSATAGKVKATGTGGKVTAQFEPDTSLNLYIAGRFHIRTVAGGNDWTNSFNSGDWSNTGDNNIKFTYDSGTTYKVETNASVAELSTQISNYDPYFFVYDTGSSKGWHPVNSAHLDDSNMSAMLTTNDATNNVKFNDTTNNDSPVTIYFNAATKELSYDVPNYYTVTCNTATGGTVSSDVAKQREGETVTLTVTPSSGYNIGTVTVKDASNNSVTVSGTGTTRTFTMPASNVTVSATFTEITHTVYVRKRYYQSDGTTVISTESTNTQTLTGVGVATAKTVNAAPTVTNYTFYKFTLPTGVTLKSGSLTTSAAITVNATVNNAVIYIDYKETMHTLTLVNNPTAGGSIKKSGTSTAITSIKVGNVTGVTLVATPNNGYQFSSWTKSASTVTIGSTSSATTTFKTSADATVTANYTAVNYTISATGSPAAGATALVTTDTSGNSKTGGTVNDLFEIRITVNAAAGYALADTNTITFQTGTGYAAPTLQTGYPTTSGNTVTYRYKLNAGSAVATVNFKAATPTFNTVRIRDRTNLTTAIDSCTAYANNATVYTYYKQPVYAKATTSDSFTSTISYATKTTGGTAIGSSTTTPCNIAADTSIIPTTEDGYVDYKFTVTATNSPTGVTAATATRNYTIRVYFNATQKAYFRLSQLLSRCVSIADGDRSYFKDDAGATITNYNSEFTTATAYINGGWPDYTASSTDAANAESKYNSFNTAYTNLMDAAKTTTVYVLTNYANSTTTPINVTFTSNSSYASGYNILRMYNYGKTISTTVESRHTTYEGYVTKSSNRYFYTITYAGRGNIRFWRGTSATDASVTTAKQLTGTITGATPFIDNYVNVYNTTYGTSATSTAISAYADFDHTFDSGKKYLEIGDIKTAAQIKALFNITPTGSMVTGSNPGITVTNTAFTIKGPVDKGINTTVDLFAGNSFTATTQGRYTVSYTSRFGYDKDGVAITRTKEMTLYVAYDDITVYVDMNDNIGNPILNFKYWQVNEVPKPSGTSGATAAYLPYEMELVTGSESIYKYTIKTSKLRTDYFLNFNSTTPLNISYITVEGKKIGESSGGFNIISEARISGEIWFKADSSHMSTFQTISCGSVSKSFIAVTESGTHTLLGEAFDALHGTGIITDNNEIYNAKYAGLYKLDGATAPMNNFHYVVNASAKREVKSGSNTYYFDKWIVCPTSSVSYNSDYTTATYSNNTDIGDADTTALNFTSAPDYADGNGDKTYIALYKLVQSGDTNVRVEITYKFKDYDTSDGNYVFDETLNSDNRIAKTVDASYTKTVTVPNTSFNAVKSSVASLAQSKVPYIKSNYFDYSFKANSTEIVSELPNESKLKISAELVETPHEYRIILKNGNTVVSNTTGHYQQTVNLASGGLSNPVWKIASGGTDVVLGSGATGSTFTARYVAVNDGDTQVIKVTNGSSTAANNKSVVSDAYTEVYYEDNGTEMLRHNFYIIDYCAEGKLTGGGVLFATTDGTNYRQSNAATVLASTTTRKNFITGILNNDFETEYKAQTINNVGFRYKPFKSTEDVYRYSNDLKAYITIYDGTNVNSANYNGQKLRLFSFMVYDNNGTKVIVPSEGYAEVDRYQPQS